MFVELAGASTFVEMAGAPTFVVLAGASSEKIIWVHSRKARLFVREKVPLVRVLLTPFVRSMAIRNLNSSVMAL